MALSIRELAKLRDEGYGPTSVIENAILKGWQGLYPPKEDAPQRTGRESTADHNDKAGDEFLRRLAAERNNDGRTIDA